MIVKQPNSTKLKHFNECTVKGKMNEVNFRISHRCVSLFCDVYGNYYMYDIFFMNKGSKNYPTPLSLFCFLLEEV